MTKQVQRRRGTDTQHTSFTGAEGELSVNTSNKSIHVHDGSTAGGIETARADLGNVSDADLNSALTGNTLSSLTITSADINGGTIDGTVIGGATPAAGNFTTGSFTGNATFGDNDKAIFGAGSDLQIYHDGSNSRILDSGTGDLSLEGANIRLRSTNGDVYAYFSSNAEAELYYNNAPKLATTSTGINVTGTVTADGLTVGGAISATGGDVDLDTLDLNAIAATKGVTAVDVFVYDTSKDSDGGAWRKRTQGTSWYNETLNTATRGARREFPAVAVIVAESNKVTIYDGDDPSLPMWMVFNKISSGKGTSYMGGATTSTATSVTMQNGDLCVGSTGSWADLRVIYFLSDNAAVYRTDSYTGTANIANRNSAIGVANDSLPNIVNDTVNDVAMTVLPNAPVDPATGLPVPTIAVATDGGVSVIKDDGTVVDLLDVAATDTNGVSFDNQNTLYVYDEGRKNIEVYYTLPNVDVTDSPDDVYNEVNAPYLFGTNTGSNLIPLAFGNNYLAISKQEAASTSQGFSLLASDKSNRASSMVAYTTSTYNTGWMPGAIKGAFLSDTDDTDLVGSGELVTNGTFDTDVSGWTAVNATLSVVSNRLRITNDGAVQGSASQTLSLIVGQRYIISGVVRPYNGQYPRVYINGVQIFQAPNANADYVFSFDFIATAASSLLELKQNNAGDSFYSDWDNISVKLADADRSVNNNGLIVNGTVTRSPVATGAELVAYSGFSTSNYLEQPYNIDLDFGTGDFCVMGWVKPNDTSVDYIASSYPNDGTSGGFLLAKLGDNTITLSSRESGNGSGTTTTASIPDGLWSHVCAVCSNSGTTQQIYINGKLSVSNSVTVRNITNSGNLLVGVRGDAAASNWRGSLALLRISATVPTAEQIKKIYKDEKVLFQENAACTLYGASDAVTALAHDDATDLLHVGTSAGRSVFQGLRRVSNTTTAVGTAISASNGLVVEE